MPLTEHSHWNYMVRSVNSYTDHVRVDRRVAVGDTNGFELVSNLGASRLAWSNGVLITSQLAGCQFYPPLKILSGSERDLGWRGWVLSGESEEPAKAQVNHQVQKNYSLNGVPVSAVVSTVTITLPNRQIVIRNWFKNGIGLIRQEQWTDKRNDVILEYLDQS